MKKVVIEKFDYEGNGITHIDGKTIFVKQAIPNETVSIKFLIEEKNYSTAVIDQIIEKASCRCNPLCEYHECGGCNLKHIDYKTEIKFKENKIKEIFASKCNLDCVKNIIVADNEYNYRNKITLKVNNNKIGYYEKETHNFVSIEKCLIANDKINDVLKNLKNIELNNIEEITIRFANESLIIFKLNKNVNIDIEKLNVDNIISEYKNKYKILKGKNYIVETLKNINYNIKNDSFFQINKNQSIKLYDEIIKCANFNKNDTVLDLYCGAGSISLYISDLVKNVIGIEINKNAIDSANTNKKINHIKNVDFICENANKIENLQTRANIIIIDPPRGGLDKKTISIIKNLSVEKLIYVSCNPITLARDINLLKNDYNCVSLTPIDMFPRTNHVEIVSLLERKNIKN